MRRALLRELERSDVSPADHRDAEHMIASLTTQIERRKRDMASALNKPPCALCGRMNSQREPLPTTGEIVCLDKSGCTRLVRRAMAKVKS